MKVYNGMITRTFKPMTGISMDITHDINDVATSSITFQESKNASFSKAAPPKCCNLIPSLFSIKSYKANVQFGYAVDMNI